MFNKNFTVYVGGLNTAIAGEYFAVFGHRATPARS